MFESNWYEIILEQQKIEIRYKISNRIKALLILILLSLILTFNIYYRLKFQPIPFFIFLIIVISILYLTFVEDKFIFNLKEKKIIILKGFLFLKFIKIKYFKDVDEITIEKHKIGFKRKDIYSLTLTFTDGQKVKFGLFKKIEDLEKFKQKIYFLKNKK